MEQTVADLKAQNETLLNEIAALKATHEQTVLQLNQQLASNTMVKESQERFETIFNESTVAQKIIDQTLKIRELNQAFTDLLGYTKDEILGSVILDYTHPDYKAQWQALQQALWKKQLSHFDLEVCLIKKDQSQVWCIVHTILFKNSGHTFGYTLLEDITNRKELERHKDDFVSVISHELKTPMTSLKMQCDLLQRHFKASEEPTVVKVISGMERQTNRLARLVRNLILVSKIESAKLLPIANNYHLEDLLQEVLQEFQDTNTGRKIDFQSNAPLVINGDRDKIYQVVYNLMTNAIKFSEPQTTIKVMLQEQAGMAMVCIQDYGRGIPQESQELIFERFYKVETASSAVEAGIGLGLYISAEIIRHQRGKLWVESTPGKGSTFCFTLPQADAQKLE